VKHPYQIEAVNRRPVGPDLADGGVIGFGEPLSRVEDVDGNVEMEGYAGFGKMGPLRHRLEVVHRLGALDLDESREFPSGGDHQIRIERARANLDGRGLLVADVDGDLRLLFLVFRLKESDEAIVLELLANGPNEDWRHWR